MLWRMPDEQQHREMMLEGVISILEGLNPRMLKVKQTGFLDRTTHEHSVSAASAHKFLAAASVATSG